MNIDTSNPAAGPTPFRLRKMTIKTLDESELHGVMYAGSHSCTGTPCSEATAPTWCNQRPTCSPSATACDGVTCTCC